METDAGRRVGRQETDGQEDEIDEVRDRRKHSVLMQRYEKLRRSIEQAGGIDDIFERHLLKKDAKVVVFCPKVEQLQSFYLLRRDWFKRVNREIHAYQTYSANPYGSKDYEAFKDDNSAALKVLYCVNQLNEGVHISGINAVVMVRPTKSPVVYKQQLGRALDIGNENEPVVFDLVNNIASAGNIVAYRQSMEAMYDEMKRDGEEGLFDPKDFDRMEKMDAAVDAIREKFGEDAIRRARFLGGGVAGSMSGGLSKHRRTGVTKPVTEEK